MALDDGRAAVLSYTSRGKLNAEINSQELTVRVLENRVDLERELALVEEEQEALRLDKLRIKTVDELLRRESECERIKAELDFLKLPLT